MPTSVTADLRWLRAGLVALAAAGLGALAHVAGGGRLPTAPEVAMLVALLVALSAAALGAPAGYGRLALLVGGGQALMHLALTATAGHGTARAQHHEPAGAHPSAATPADDLDGGAAHLLEHLGAEISGTPLVMTLAHLAAAAGVAAWLYAGEQALWALVALLGALVVGRLLTTASLLGLGGRSCGPRPAAARAVARHRPPRQHAFAANGPTGRRGPPPVRRPPSPTT